MEQVTIKKFSYLVEPETGKVVYLKYERRAEVIGRFLDLLTVEIRGKHFVISGGFIKRG